MKFLLFFVALLSVPAGIVAQILFPPIISPLLGPGFFTAAAPSSALSAVRVRAQRNYDGLNQPDTWGIDSNHYSLPVWGQLADNASGVQKPGYQLSLIAPKNATWDEIFKNQSAYPNIMRDLRKQQTVDPGNWGEGDSFDESALPDVGDTVVLPDGTQKTVSQVSQCVPMINQCWQGSTQVFGQSQRPGFSCMYGPNNTGSLNVWTACRGTGSSGKSIYGNVYTFSTAPPADKPDDYTDEQKASAAAANPSEIGRAAVGAFVAEHGAGSTTEDFPKSGKTKILDPLTGGIPVAAQISQNLSAAAENAENNNIEITAVTTGDITRTTVSRPSVETDPETGEQVRTVVTTTTVSNSAGDILSIETTTTRTTTDAAGNTATETETTKTGTYDAISAPDVSRINLDPLKSVVNVMRNHFPTNLVVGLGDAIVFFYTPAVIPEFDLSMGETWTIHLTMSLLNTLALAFRNLLAFAIWWFAVWESVYVWIQ